MAKRSRDENTQNNERTRKIDGRFLLPCGKEICATSETGEKIGTRATA